MDWTAIIIAIIPIVCSVIVALLSRKRAKLAEAGQKADAAVIDAVIDAIEATNNSALKGLINAKAKADGVKGGLDAKLDAKGYRSKKWVSELK